MNKEYLVVGGLALIILASVLDSLAGPVSLVVGRNPFSFLSPDYLSTYPFTAVAIGVRALGLVVLVMTAISTIERQYSLKAVGVLVLGVLAELYSVQQLATGLRTTPINWTLAFAYAGLALAPAVLIYLLRGAFSGVSSKVSGAPEEKNEDSQKRIEKIKELSKEDKGLPPTAT